jgi:hypothetical protein
MTRQDAVSDGVVALALREGFDGFAQITLEARGVEVPLPSLPLLQQTAVTVQLRNVQGSFGRPATARRRSPTSRASSATNRIRAVTATCAGR